MSKQTWIIIGAIVLVVVIIIVVMVNKSKVPPATNTTTTNNSGTTGFAGMSAYINQTMNQLLQQYSQQQNNSTSGNNSSNTNNSTQNVSQESSSTPYGWNKVFKNSDGTYSRLVKKGYNRQGNYYEDSTGTRYYKPGLFTSIDETDPLPDNFDRSTGEMWWVEGTPGNWTVLKGYREGDFVNNKS